MSDLDRRPTRLGTTLALLAAAVSLAGSALGAPSAGALAALGVVVLAVGLFVGSHRAVSLAAVCQLGGVFLAGWAGAPAEPLLVATVGSVLAWDVGSYAIDVGEQLGRETSTRRLEAVHAASSVVVAGVTVGVGYGTYLAASGGQPVAAVVFLLGGVVVLVSGFR